MLFWQDLKLHKTKRNLAVNDFISPQTTSSQQKPYGRNGCYLVEKNVAIILKKAHNRLGH